MDEKPKFNNKPSQLTTENLQKIEGKKMRSMAAQSLIGFNMNSNLSDLKPAGGMAMGPPGLSAGQMFKCMDLAASMNTGIGGMNNMFMMGQADDDNQSMNSGFNSLNPYSSMLRPGTQSMFGFPQQ